MSLFLPVPLSVNATIFPVHAPVPSDLVVTADAAVYVAPSLTAPLAPCTVLKPVLQFSARIIHDDSSRNHAVARD
jgi:hypothetical protein